MLKQMYKADTYVPFYVLEKEQKPDKKLWWLQFYKSDVDTVDKILELAHGNRDVVQSDTDWRVVEELLKFFAYRWPEEFADFKTAVDTIRHTRNPGAYSRSKEIMQVGALPPRFERLIKAIFTHQQFNKKFVYQLVRRFKIFKVYKESN
jgi:hypothetical protein